MKLLGVLLCGLLAACSAPAVDEGDESTDEAALKKRIDAGVTTAGLHFEAGNYGPGAFLNWISLTGRDKKVLPGDSLELPPGPYWPRLAGDFAMFHEGPNSAYDLGERVVMSGATTSVPALACLSLQSATPITLAASSPSLSVMRGQDGNYAFARLPLSKYAAELGSASGVRMLIQRGYSDLTLRYATTWKNIALKDGKCVTAKLPTVAITAEVDDIDPAFPDPQWVTGDSNVRVVVGGVPMPIRAFGTQTALAGLEVKVVAWGVSETAAKASYFPKQGTLKVHVNRLEVEHLVETSLDGSKRSVPGHYDVYHVTTLGKDRIVGGAATQTGVDLVDGDYEVVLRGQGAVGPISQTRKVSFP
ncbi:MAG: hypothetical protein IPG50_26975 [Myxococcales bacterium]|nr:hypothetical protein [Myxococcales bacterium]